jgi:hypothetical protein
MARYALLARFYSPGTWTESTKTASAVLPPRLLHATVALGGWTMNFEEILDQAIAMLQRRGRLTYGTLKRQFGLDDAALKDLQNELIKGQRLAQMV